MPPWPGNYSPGSGVSAATWQWLQEEGARFYAQLQEMAGLTVWPGRANYLFLRCDRADFDLQYALLRQHVLIRSCANYPGLDSPLFPGGDPQRRGKRPAAGGVAPGAGLRPTAG
ncbi:L-threonine 3-O-phosphate decarboxylase [Klebsiella pneumoniae]|uniref:L-threonine 3-O-phosphate decarboxylase n=1 Tax=Klebsiella pneumoniae TaxID=573 RepID=A0A377V9A2_KLEPN|nr:L-threonine 3-O-phosphate decarboxylase [Klebsiella pneumoniae]